MTLVQHKDGRWGEVVGGTYDGAERRTGYAVRPFGKMRAEPWRFGEVVARTKGGV